MKKILTSIVLTAALAIGATGCGDGKHELRKVGQHELKKVEDVTGDGVTDVLIDIRADSFRDVGNYLFIGKEDGTFIRTQEMNDKNGIKYFLSDEGVAWFLDGSIYKPSQQ
ncbi:hypothetical protein HZA97_08970 [Candidatus Woesearchaeota archaeon]|nr:hypothetical protein [Candidatus Woesearchaeota archaeon]